MTTGAKSRTDARGVGNIYDRLDDARRKRERILDTPSPANRPKRPFPKLRAPKDFARDSAPDDPRGSWAAPVLLALTILVVIFVYAVA